jgi:hypothetical protein
MIPKLTLISTTEVGVYGEHRQVIAEDKNQNQARFIWWNGGDYSPPDAEFDVVCQLSRSDYKGALQVSAEWVDFRITEKGREEIQSRQFEIIDRRNYLNPINEVLNFLAENPKSQVWGEGQTPKDLPCKGRHELKPAATLVIWTAPPSQSLLNAVIRQVKPKKVIVYAIDPQLSDPKAFLERLAGLAKYAIKHKDGKADLDALASACAANRDSIQLGFQYWSAKGRLTVQFNGGELIIKPAQEQPNPDAAAIYQQLIGDSLAESRAFRNYFKSGSLENYFSQK